MAHINDSTQPSEQRLGLINDMNFSSMDMTAQRPAKDLVPPQVDPVHPFSSTQGMYIPPEETRQNEGSLDEIMGWSLSDDQQDTEEDDDDDMDDNEFDLDFDDADYPPPIKPEDQTPGFCERHMSHPKFNLLQSSPYVPTYSSFPYYAFTGTSRRNSQQEAAQFGNSEDAPPVRFIDPSSLQLPHRWSFSNSSDNTLNGHSNAASTAAPRQNSIDSTSKGVLNNSSRQAMSVNDTNDYNENANERNDNVALSGVSTKRDDSEFNASPSASSVLPSDLNTSYNTQSNLPTPPSFSEFNSPDGLPADLTDSNLGLGLDDIDIDMGMNEVYPLSSASQLEKEDKEPTPAVRKGEPVQDEIAEVAVPSPKNEPIREVTPEVAPSAARLASPQKRKTQRRKAAFNHRYSPASTSSHSSAHVCNMTYPDGSECHRSFTRPYDLARHQETLHAAVRKMYTCEVCGENSKTFSRLDALSRHMRLKHS